LKRGLISSQDLFLKLFFYFSEKKIIPEMNNLNAALLILVLVASAVNVLAAPTDDSEQYQFHVQIN
jgi:hypothetical protein